MKLRSSMPATTLALVFLSVIGAAPLHAQSLPTVTTGTGNSIRPGQALIRGTVNPSNAPTTYWFEHGPSSAYGNTTPASTLAAGTNPVAVTNLITSIARGSSYNFRLVASNSLGEVAGANAKFVSPAGSTIDSTRAGNGQPLDTRMPVLELNYIISTGGIYPSSSGNVEPPFVAEVRLFAGSFAPSGWLFCHGQFLNIDDYDALFSILGTNYGGDGQTTFRLPDLRGRTVVGSGLGSDGFTRTIGQTGGQDHVTLTRTNLALHNHTLPPPDASTGTGYTGDGQSYTNLQPYTVMSANIWRTGVFPVPDSSIDEPMLAQISFFAGTYALNNPMPATGQLLPINQNQALFAIIGTYYGGNGQTTFALPDLRGRTPMGIGAGPGPTSWEIAARPGQANTIPSANELPAHQHTATSLSIQTGPAGVGAPISLMKPTLAIRYIICTNGIFPPHEAVPAKANAPSATPKAFGAQYLGQINLFAGSYVPGGWLACEGQILSIQNNVALFSILGTYYGGNGRTTFALPDLTSRIPVGSINGIPGAKYGAQQATLTTAELPPHTHTVPVLDFDRWITTYGQSGTEAAFDADPDNDGANNAYEWATGSNPTNVNPANRLIILSTDERVSITFPRNTNATDLRIAVQRTTELTPANQWTTAASNHLGQWVLPAAPMTLSESASTNPRQVTITDSKTNRPSSTYRLRID